jgi:formylglycine-generating enzyme required for sulfatase activity
LLSQIAWYGSNSGSQTRPVGGKAANAFGFHDMLGNVYEWVDDWYGTYPSISQTDPSGPVSAAGRVIRGGGWNVGTNVVRSSSRDLFPSGYTTDYIGFRVARTP